MKSNDYACRGAAFATHQDAAVAMEAEVFEMRAAPQRRELATTPWTYVCVEGHVHYRIVEVTS